MPFVDDVIIASDYRTSLIEDLQEVLRQLDKYGITIKTLKCVFGNENIKLLMSFVGNVKLLPSDVFISVCSYNFFNRKHSS